MQIYHFFPTPCKLSKHSPNEIAQLQKEMKQKMKRLPYILGTEAVRMARKQIDEGGSINNGFTQWPQRKEQAFMAIPSKLGKNSEGKLEHVATKIKFTDQGKQNNNRGLLNPGGKMYRAIKYQVSDNPFYKSNKMGY